MRPVSEVAPDSPLEEAGFEPSVPLEVAVPELPECTNGQFLKGFFVPRTEDSNLAPPSGASRRQSVRQGNQLVERHPPRRELETGAGGRWRGLNRRQPSHPALRSPSTKWAWSSGRNHGTRFRTYMSNAAGARETALSSASFASAMRPS